MKVEINCDELYPCYGIDKNSKYADKEISEELYNRYIKAKKEYFAVQEILKELR